MYSCTCACVCTVRAQNYASIIIVNSRPSSSCCSKYQFDSYWHPFVEQMSECTVLSKVWCWSRHSPKPPLNPQSWANDTEQSFHVSYPNVPNWQACSRAGDAKNAVQKGLRYCPSWAGKIHFWWRHGHKKHYFPLLLYSCKSDDKWGKLGIQKGVGPRPVPV